MFDFSFGEIMTAGVVALVVLGPERLPKVARTVGEWIGKMQRMAGNVKQELTQHAEYAELNKIKQDFEHAAHDIKQELHDTVPAWERLPEQHIPADFGVGEDGRILPQVSGLYTKSLKKQSMARKRDLRLRVRSKPKLRSRK